MSKMNLLVPLATCWILLLIQPVKLQLFSSKNSILDLVISVLSQDSDLNLIDKLLLDVIPPLIDQPACNARSTFSHFKQEAFEDQSSINASYVTIQQMISNSGFKYKNYDVISADGYYTQLVRIINPLADRRHLKRPPVMMMHGGAADPACWMWTASNKHHPEVYPRSIHDGPITSHNRSLAFVLANNGHDVWLVGTRGADARNAKKRPHKLLHSIMTGKTLKKNMTLGETLLQVAERDKYWSYSMNELIDYELDGQIKKVLQVTRSGKVDLIVYSLSTMFSIAYLGQKAQLEDPKVNSYVQFAPIISEAAGSKLFKLATSIVRMIDDDLGTYLTSKIFLTQSNRDLLTKVSDDLSLRYTLIKFIYSLMYGSSPKFRTHLDLNIGGHSFQGTSFIETKHFCQQIEAQQYQKFDHGSIKNQLIYGSEKPPIYNISQLGISSWMIVSGENDIASTPHSVMLIKNMVKNIQPEHINIQDYNHLDISAAFDNDVLINLPVMQFLDRNKLD